MVALLTALLAVPASASAQEVAQDISIAGSVVSADGDRERTVRFTVTNNGPGAFDGGTIHAWTLVQASPQDITILSMSPNCAERGYGARCDHGARLDQGESRSVDIKVRFTSANYENDKLIGMARFDDGTDSSFEIDPNPDNDQVEVDLGITPAPPSMRVEWGLSRIVQHGDLERRSVSVTNTGGTTLTDISISDTRCADYERIGPEELPPLSVETVGFICTARVPTKHVKGEKPLRSTITVTARAGDQTLTRTKTMTSYLAEKNRRCGTLMIDGKRYTARSSIPDLSCRAARRRLRRCAALGRAPKGFKCTQTDTLVHVFRKHALVPTRVFAFLSP